MKAISKNEILDKVKSLKVNNPGACEEALALVQALCKTLSTNEAEGKLVTELSKLLGLEYKMSADDKRTASSESYMNKS